MDVRCNECKDNSAALQNEYVKLRKSLDAKSAARRARKSNVTEAKESVRHDSGSSAGSAKCVSLGTSKVQTSDTVDVSAQISSLTALIQSLASRMDSDKEAQAQRDAKFKESLDSKFDSIIGRITAIENAPSEADSVEASEANDDVDDSRGGYF